MSFDDDEIRRALSTSAETPGARHTLEQLRPAMQRARRRRTLAASATVVTLVIGGGIGVAALSATNRPTTHSVTSAAASPAATPPPVPSSTIATAASEAEAPLVQSPPETIASTTEVPTPVDDGVEAAVEEAPAPAPAPPAPTVDATPTTPPPPPVVEPSAAVEPPPPTPVPATRQTISSRCGDVVVSIDSGELRIVSISPHQGFTERVSDDGPTSVEVEFGAKGDAGTCEIHAELEQGMLDVEVQNPAGTPSGRLSRRQSTLRRWPADAADGTAEPLPCVQRGSARTVRNITMLIDANAATRNHWFGASVPAVIA